MSSPSHEFVLAISVPEAPVEIVRVTEAAVVLGRSEECDIVLNDKWVSPRHLTIRYKDGDLLLTDLTSANGTFEPDGTSMLGRTVRVREGERYLVGVRVHVTILRVPTP